MFSESPCFPGCLSPISKSPFDKGIISTANYERTRHVLTTKEEVLDLGKDQWRFYGVQGVVAPRNLRNLRGSSHSWPMLWGGAQSPLKKFSKEAVKGIPSSDTAYIFIRIHNFLLSFNFLKFFYFKIILKLILSDIISFAYLIV